MPIELSVCPGTLKNGFTSYSTRACKDLFNGSQVDHDLPLELPEDGSSTYVLGLHRKKFSIDDAGAYVLQTSIPDRLNGDQYPANLHLTLQIARQVFQLHAVPSAMIFLSDGSAACIRKRHDLYNDRVCAATDFFRLAGLSGSRPEDQYQLSYLDLGKLIDQHFPAAIPAKEELFRQVVFNYLVSNGGAHLKKFAAIDGEGKCDWKFSPAFDIANTALHGDSSDLALLDGLYPKDFEKLSYKTLGYYGYDDFFQFGLKLGLVSYRIKRFTDHLLENSDEVEELIQRSFLSEELKNEYIRSYRNRHEKLANSLSGLYLPNIK